MERCSVCGEAAPLFVGGLPLCVTCDQKRNNPDELWENVKATKAEHLELSKQFDELNKQIMSGAEAIPFPDSTHRIEHLGARVRFAFQRYQHAVERYTEALKRQ